jgi:hypothetical protein
MKRGGGGVVTGESGSHNPVFREFVATSQISRPFRLPQRSAKRVFAAKPLASDRAVRGFCLFTSLVQRPADACSIATVEVFRDQRLRFCNLSRFSCLQRRGKYATS